MYIRNVAKLLFAFAEATVTVITRKVCRMMSRAVSCDIM